ncbi:hypothetical protein WJX72_011341 [[Myrmecia] bisecta]|uniref:Uncharacterized protein n=1 Tax=[Myrmecia] bisecta TaxID=41462 RepID=A0AAW1QST8_9CHLO
MREHGDASSSRGAKPSQAVLYDATTQVDYSLTYGQLVDPTAPHNGAHHQIDPSHTAPGGGTGTCSLLLQRLTKEANADELVRMQVQALQDKLHRATMVRKHERRRYDPVHGYTTLEATLQYIQTHRPRSSGSTASASQHPEQQHASREPCPPSTSSPVQPQQPSHQRQRHTHSSLQQHSYSELRLLSLSPLLLLALPVHGDLGEGLEAPVQLIYLLTLLGFLVVGAYLVVRQVLIRRELEEAAKVLGERIRAGEASPEDCFELGVILLRKKLYTQATKNLEKAKKSWDGEPEELAQVHNALGFAYFSMERNDLAVAEYEKAVRLQPGYVTAWNNLGDALEKARKYEEAFKAYSEALSYAPDNKVAKARSDAMKTRLQRMGA